jgi:hypothetical protein
MADEMKSQPPPANTDQPSQATAENAAARFMSDTDPHQSFLVTGKSKRTRQADQQRMKDWHSTWTEASKKK